jgi:hypothetical protein
MNFNVFISEISSIRQKKKDLRNFGYVFFGAGVVFAGISYYKHGWESKMIPVFLVAGIIFLLCGLLVPNLLKPLHKFWMVLGILLGYFFSKIILSLVFVLAITPIGFILRLIKKDILDLTIDKDDLSFWKDCQNTRDKSRYEKMF